jgi:hypothetical protein
VPFLSIEQKTYLEHNKPALASKWAKLTPKGKLPEKVKPMRKNLPPADIETPQEALMPNEEKEPTTPAKKGKGKMSPAMLKQMEKMRAKKHKKPMRQVKYLPQGG